MIIYAERNVDGTIKALYDGGERGKGGIPQDIITDEIDDQSTEVAVFLNPPLQLDQKIANVQPDNSATLQAIAASIVAMNNNEPIPDWALSILNDLNVKVQEVVTLDAQEKQTALKLP